MVYMTGAASQLGRQVELTRAYGDGTLERQSKRSYSSGHSLLSESRESERVERSGSVGDLTEMMQGPGWNGSSLMGLLEWMYEGF